MATSRTRGPLGLQPVDTNFGEENQCRFRACVPGPLRGSENFARSIAPAFQNRPFVTAHQQARKLDLPILRPGSRGLAVQRLQRQLNARLAPPWKIAADGVFGPVMFQAVVAYQKGVSIHSDGIVGAETWYHLLKGDKPGFLPAATLSATAVTATPRNAVPPTSVASPKADDIWEWTLEKRFAEALRRTAPRLPEDIRHEFERLISPTSLAITAGTLVTWAAAHAFGVGQIVDIVLLVGGVFVLGLAVFDVAAELADFLVLTAGATESKELDEAAAHLARAITTMGVATFVAVLTRLARRRGGGRGGGDVSRKGSPKTPATPKIDTSSTYQKPSAAPSAEASIRTSKTKNAQTLEKQNLPAAENPAGFSKSALQVRLQNQHLGQLEKYGAGGFKELSNGRIRYYGQVHPSTNPGTMVGRRLVREWDPASGATRTWHETLDQAGRVRIVRPETGGPKVHYMFDEAGNFTGSW